MASSKLSREPNWLDRERPAVAAETPTVEASSLPGERDSQAAQAAPIEREPTGLSILAAPVPLSAPSPVDESQMPSRVKLRLKGVRLPIDELEDQETWCRIHHIKFQDVCAQALREKFSLIAAGEMWKSELANQLTTPKTLVNQLTTSGPELPLLANQLTNLPRAKDLDLFLDLECEEKIDDQEKERTIDEADKQLLQSSSVDSSPDLETGYPVNQSGAAIDLTTDPKEAAVLEFYRAQSRNRIQPRDRRAYHEGNSENPGLADVPMHVIQLGIMESILICAGPIHSLSYCLGRIHLHFECADAADLREVNEMFLRTFAARMERKKNPGLSHEEYMEKIRLAARGQQPTLPNVGGDLKEIKAPAASQEELARFEAMTEAERQEDIRRRLGYYGPDAQEKAASG